MANLMYRIKNDKKFFVIMMVVLFVVLFDLFVLVFDVVQFVELSKNVANRFAGFKSINIVAGIFSILATVAICVYLVLMKKTIKVDLSQKDKKR